MANKMLIDATHPEETRVVVLRGSRVDEFDFESASKRQLRGNIYLAKVIRVEPALQAAFVDYGGNRHGFLAFTEIHPDYYQIPVSDRQALLEDEAREEQDEEEERRPRRSRRRRGGDRPVAAANRGADDHVVSEPAEPTDHRDAGAEQTPTEDAVDESNAAGPSDPSDAGADHEADHRPVQLDASQTPPYDDPTADLIERASKVHESQPPESREPHNDEGTYPDAGIADEPDVTGVPDENQGTAHHHESPTSDADVGTGSPVTAAGEAPDDRSDPSDRQSGDDALDDMDESDDHDEDEPVDQLGGDALEEVPRRAYRSRRQYKIQEVIKRRQVLLVQVVKEERGNKGAAITTYLSLAGRYSVLMPNTARGGGISRKITDAGDRQRLKSIAQELEVPDGMGVILRTAGAMRSKPEVKRDFEYLMRMWETVRETTLQSTAPMLVYEEGSLIKRAIRDLYNSDIEEIVVAGDEAYREAKDFMRLLTPSQVKNVQPWRDPAPLFTKAGAEAQLDAMFSNHVTLKSGGYLVINQTEALVAIDVNSGRSTREHNIEDTALRTNLEAADEVARQLRLRDLAGLIVVDFIDMEETRNNRAVERRVKDALKDDRARIQIGRISHFGLLEMSRQRIRTGVLEGSTEVCQHCAGAGMVRSTASIALHVLRLTEDALITDASRDVVVRTRGAVALYILNHKRAHLDELEGRFGAAVVFQNDEHLTGTVYCSMERGEPASGTVRPRRLAPIEDVADEPVEDVVEETVSETDQETGAAGDERGEPKRRRRRRGRGRDRESSGISQDAPQPSDDGLALMGAAPAPAAALDDGESQEGSDAAPPAGEDPRGRRRRSRRGSRRTRDLEPEQEGRDLVAASEAEPVGHDQPAHDATTGVAESISVDAMSAGPGAPIGVTLPPPLPEHAVAHSAASEPSARPEPAAALPSAPPTIAEPTADESGVPDMSTAEGRASRPEPVSSELDPSRPKRSGWWQRAKATLSG